MERTRVLLLVLVLALVGGWLGWRSYSAAPVKASERAADATLEADALYQAFVADEAAAGKQYNDKVVQVSGVVRGVDPEEGRLNVMLETTDAMAGVVCEFAMNDLPASWKKGDRVTLKGVCAGINMDVLLQRCAAVE